MKVHDTFKRLYMVTGKGGVGKTSLSLAIAQRLKDHGENVLYIDFENGFQQEYLKKKHIHSFRINLDESLKQYVARKLKSQTIANWVVKTPFFSSLVGMIPGFSYLIYLGHILDMLDHDPSLIIVLDSPASGHALTMLEATYNFREIFRSGILFEDINKMIKYGYDPKILEVIVCTIPTQLAIQEAIELKEGLKKVQVEETKIALNNMLTHFEDDDSKLPDILDHKLKVEKEIIHQYQNKITSYLSYSTHKEKEKIIAEMSEQLEGLI